MIIVEGRITRITPADRRGRWIELEMDGRPWATLDAETVLRAALTRDRVLDEKQRARLLETDEAIRARKAAAGFNARTPKTRREIEQYLAAKGFSEQAAQAALRELSESGTLNEARVVTREIGAGRRKRQGPAAVQAKLRRRGVDPDEADRRVKEVFAQIDVAAECLELARKAAHKYQPIGDPRQQQKLTQYLRRRGYDGETVREAIEQILEESP